MRDDEREQPAREGERYREQDDERAFEALELRDHHEVDEHEAQDGQHEHLLQHVGDALVHAGDLHLIALRHLDFVERGLQLAGEQGDVVAVFDLGRDRRDVAHVLAGDGRHARRFRDACHLGELVRSTGTVGELLVEQVLARRVLHVRVVYAHLNVTSVLAYGRRLLLVGEQRRYLLVDLGACCAEARELVFVEDEVQSGVCLLLAVFHLGVAVDGVHRVHDLARQLEHGVVVQTRDGDGRIAAHHVGHVHALALSERHPEVRRDADDFVLQIFHLRLGRDFRSIHSRIQHEAPRVKRAARVHPRHHRGDTCVRVNHAHLRDAVESRHALPYLVSQLVAVCLGRLLVVHFHHDLYLALGHVRHHHDAHLRNQHKRGDEQQRGHGQGERAVTQAKP